MSFSPRLGAKVPHKDLYKSPLASHSVHIHSNENSNDSNESPSWRNAYKKRCFDEFKKSRQKLVNKFRNFQINDNKTTKLRDYLDEELQKICLLEAKTSHDLITIDEAIDIYKQIQIELISNSFKDINDNQLEEILVNIDREEEFIKNVTSNSSDVICPVCQRSNLVELDSMIACKNNSKGCSFRIDTSSTKETLTEFAARLDSAIRQHQQEQCSEVPVFLFKTADRLNKNEAFLINELSCPSASCFLMMSCEKCNLDLII